MRPALWRQAQKLNARLQTSFQNTIMRNNNTLSLLPLSIVLASFAPISLVSSFFPSLPNPPRFRYLLLRSLNPLNPPSHSLPLRPLHGHPLRDPGRVRDHIRVLSGGRRPCKGRGLGREGCGGCRGDGGGGGDTGS